MPSLVKRAALLLQKEYHAPLFTALEPREAFSGLVIDYTCNHANSRILKSIAKPTSTQ